MRAAQIEPLKTGTPEEIVKGLPTDKTLIRRVASCLILFQRIDCLTQWAEHQPLIKRYLQVHQRIVTRSSDPKIPVKKYRYESGVLPESKLGSMILFGNIYWVILQVLEYNREEASSRETVCPDLLLYTLSEIAPDDPDIMLTTLLQKNTWIREIA